MTIPIQNPRWRLVMMGGEALALIFAVAWTVKGFIAGRLAGEGATPERLETAARLDPSNAIYQLDLGRFYQYVPAEINAESAILHLKRAVELNPQEAEAWVDLGAAFELQGQIRDAETCFDRANELAPRLPKVQWAIANFLLLHGDVDKSFAHFQAVLAGSSRYNQTIFDIAWKASGNADQILQEVIPRAVPAELAYLHYLVLLDRLTEAQAVWKRLINDPSKSMLFAAGEFIDRLMQTGRPDEAFAVWTDLRQKGLVDQNLPAEKENLLVNGSFESEIENMGFGWRVSTPSGVRIWRDSSESQSGGFSLAVEFLGQENLEFHHVYQYAVVAPGKTYELVAYLKTKGITTNSGARLEVRDAYNPASLDELSDDLTGDSMGWVKQSVVFKCGPENHLVRVGLARMPSAKLDNQIAGRVWVDDVKLALAARP